MDKHIAHGDDRFRIFAAFLVMTIHTSPLSVYSETLDFILTRIIGRIAVPYFFMLTGYFLLSPYMESRHTSFLSCRKFLIKTSLIYVISMLLYLPLNFYAGHFKGGGSVIEIIRGILFEGTFYHLWYLPAMILGIIIVYMLMQICNRTAVLIITICLFIIGLFGDSYYGVISGVPIISSIYNGLFNLFGYTRNGLFYAPVFLVSGAWIRTRRQQPKPFINRAGFSISMFLMLAEGLILHAFNVQRHDSMYFFLLPAMYFLFQWIMSINGKANKRIRTIAMLIYIIHPWSIVVIRGFAKTTGLMGLLVNNSLIHYLVVCSLSMAVAILLTALESKIRKPKFQKGRAWLEINQSRLRHNAALLQSMLPESCALMPAIKADAYGHGAIEIGKELNHFGIRAFCVATAVEGAALRKGGVKGDILILGYTHPEQFGFLKKYRLIQTIVDYPYALLLNHFGRKIRTHIKIDTGMRRLGEHYENTKDILQMFQCENLRIEGMYTHLSVSDNKWEADQEFTYQQIASFYEVVEAVEKAGLKRPKLHIQNSYGVLNYPDISCDYARVGIALYGAVESDLSLEESPKFLPVLEVKARIAVVKIVSCGEAVGYGRQYTASQNMKIAVLSIGYADGIPRQLSCGRGHVIIHGEKAAIVGRICMDQMTVDITHIKEAKQGDEAIIIGESGMHAITACGIAEQANTIPNEILSRLGGRLERIYM